MSRISRGWDTPATGDWRFTGFRLPGGTRTPPFGPADSPGVAWFASGSHPGVRVVVTVLPTGDLAGFEVHNEGVERAHPPRDADPADYEPYPPLADIPIGSRMVRSIPIAGLVRATKAKMADFADEIAGVARGTRVADAYADRALGLRRRPGRAGHPDTYYAGLAVRYEAWQTTGAPLEALVDGEHVSTVSALRAQLHTARRKGFLTDAPKGRAGGMATGKARDLLESGA